MRRIRGVEPDRVHPRHVRGVLAVGKCVRSGGTAGTGGASVVLVPQIVKHVPVQLASPLRLVGADLAVSYLRLTCCGILLREYYAGVIQLVECQLPKLDVAGSSPVARSVENQ
jgi:hypothetical protein